MKTSNRIYFIDIAKGMTILLVAIYHSSLYAFLEELMQPISLIRMPLFFFVSGYLLSKKTRLITYFLYKADALLKPYFFVSLLLAVLYTSQNNFLDGVLGALYATGSSIYWMPMWYLAHLYLVSCFSRTVLEILHSYLQTLPFKLIFLTSLFIGGFYFINQFWDSNLLPYNGLPFSLDILGLTSLYFLSGYLFKEIILDKIDSLLLFFVSLFSFLLIASYTGATIDFNTRSYQEPIYALIGSYAGIFCILFICKKIEKLRFLKSLFMYLGQSSLSILIFHQYLFYKLERGLIVFINLDASTSLVLSLLVFIVGLSITLIISECIKRSKILSKIMLPTYSKSSKKYIASNA